MHFLLEPLTPVDISERAQALEKLIGHYYKHGVEPDVWKIEGVEKRDEYERIVGAARAGGRSEVGVVVLGRGEDYPTVERWLSAAKNVPGMIGFALGRSVFWESIKELHKGNITGKEASSQIATNFLKCYRVFTGIRV